MTRKTYRREELVRNAEHDQGSILDDVAQVGNRDQVLGQLHLGKVTRVLVRLVDDVGQLALAGDLCKSRTSEKKSDPAIEPVE
jgi:hypothetical protein